MGELSVTERQAEKLGLRSYSSMSPQLEKCCLLLSANSSYARAEEDIEVLTGIKVSRSTQQRLVHQVIIPEAIATEFIEGMDIDGGASRFCKEARPRAFHSNRHSDGVKPVPHFPFSIALPRFGFFYLSA